MNNPEKGIGMLILVLGIAVACATAVYASANTAYPVFLDGIKVIAGAVTASLLVIAGKAIIWTGENRSE